MGKQSIKETRGNAGNNLLEYVNKSANTIAGFCENHRFWLLSFFSTIYFAAIGLISVHKTLENDELYTLNIARLASLSEVWSALLTGAEQLPPFFYVLTRASIALFGENAFALRLPAMVGVWIMCLCLFHFVTIRSTALYGLVAMLFPLTTGAYYYAYEARPYGLVLGFSGLALICWQTLAENNHRLTMLVLFALSLAAAISCHYYAVLILIPFACGEIVRAIKMRRPDVSIWTAMIISLAPLLIFLPLIKSAKSYSTAFWAQPVWGDAPYFYYFMLISAALPITAFLILVALYVTLSKKEYLVADDEPESSLTVHETAALIGFLAIPFVSVAMAVFVTHAFTYRYALPATLGLGIMLPMAFKWLLRGHNLLTLLLVLLLTLGFARRGGMVLQEVEARNQQRRQAIKMMQQNDEKALPIVCSDAHIFLVLSHYAPPEIKSRLVYLGDPERSMRYLGHNSVERGMFEMLKPWFHLNIEPYQNYLASGKGFLLIADSENFLNWILTDLPATGRHIELRGRSKQFMLFLVKPAE